MISRQDFGRVITTARSFIRDELELAGIFPAGNLAHWRRFQDNPLLYLLDEGDAGEGLWQMIIVKIATENSMVNVQQFYWSLKFGLSDCIGLDHEKLRWAKELKAAGKVTITDSPSGPMVALVDSTPVKIIGRDNFARDTVSDFIVAENLKLGHALPMCEALNAPLTDNSPTIFAIVHADQELYVVDHTGEPLVPASAEHIDRVA